MRDVAHINPDTEADQVASWADTALPRAIGSVANVICRIDGAQLALNTAGLDVRSVADRLRNPADLVAARLMVRGLFARSPAIRSPRRALA